MIEEKINKLREKLEQQLERNESYETVYKTSSEIDRLIVQYYKAYGLRGAKQIL